MGMRCAREKRSPLGGRKDQAGRSETPFRPHSDLCAHGPSVMEVGHPDWHSLTDGMENRFSEFREGRYEEAGKRPEVTFSLALSGCLKTLRRHNVHLTFIRPHVRPLTETR